MHQRVSWVSKAHSGGSVIFDIQQRKYDPLILLVSGLLPIIIPPIIFAVAWILNKWLHLNNHIIDFVGAASLIWLMILAFFCYERWIWIFSTFLFAFLRRKHNVKLMVSPDKIKLLSKNSRSYPHEISFNQISEYYVGNAVSLITDAMDYLGMRKKLSDISYFVACNVSGSQIRLADHLSIDEANYLLGEVKSLNDV